jgi:hypothetical protein
MVSFMVMKDGIVRESDQLLEREVRSHSVDLAKPQGLADPS